MKRILTFTLFGAGIALLGGCPIYSDNSDSNSGGSSGYRICDGNTCYDCPGSAYSSACVPWQCSSDYDCPSSYSCTENNECSANGSAVFDAGSSTTPGQCSVPGDCPNETCGADNTCHAGDCSEWGCPTQFVCELENGTLACVGTGPSIDGGGSTPVPDGGGVPDSSAPSYCQSNADCIDMPGELCLDGACVPPTAQCFDGTQCLAGDQCVAGACTPTCGADGGGATCPTGYSCDSHGDCTGNSAPCVNGDATGCPGGTVCSLDHCVAPCGAASSCAAGLQCVQGGCVPTQTASFVCTTDGVQDACHTGSICIHHACYIACASDAGDASSCAGADTFNVCTSVTTGSGGTYSVCGSGTNLGSECDPTQGKACANSSAVCIDGYCR